MCIIEAVLCVIGTFCAENYIERITNVLQFNFRRYIYIYNEELVLYLQLFVYLQQ